MNKAFELKRALDSALELRLKSPVIYCWNFRHSMGEYYNKKISSLLLVSTFIDLKKIIKIGKIYYSTVAKGNAALISPVI